MCLKALRLCLIHFLSSRAGGDDGYFSVVQRTFCIENRYILSFASDGYIKGLPCGYYINNFLSVYHSTTIRSTYQFVSLFQQFINQYLDGEHIVAYFAGYDDNGVNRVPYLFLLDRGRITRLNYDEQNVQILYNYHAVGNSLWINKLILPTLFMDNAQGQEESFQAAAIDFSKYSLSIAVKFAHFLLDLTGKMDTLAQITPTVNKYYTTARLTPWDGASFNNQMSRIFML